MRPLTLTIEGLRSFRSPVEISFHGRDHLAVIGDTGVGKSSILEAMTYALYGRTTFTGHANQEIMNDLADYMRVTLRFTVARRTFEVTRVLRRASDRTVGAAKASLTEFGTDGGEIQRIEQVRQVNRRIQDALGLDAEAFIRTVVLPQGQFAQLLVGDDPAARAAILRQVWRTDELSRAGQLADEALPPLAQLVGQVTQALDGTPEDPQAHLEQLQADAGRCREFAKRARDTHGAATAARDTVAQAYELAEAAEKVQKRIQGFDFRAAAATAAEVVRGAAAIAADRAEAEKEQETLRAQLRAVPSDDDGLAYQAIGAARAGLDRLPSRAEAAANTAERARTEAAEAETAEQRTAELDKELQDLGRILEQRQEARKNLDSALADADVKLTDAQTLLRDAQRAAAEVDGLATQAGDKTHQVQLLRQQAAQLKEHDLAQAERRAATAETAYAHAQRHNAAAAAADGLQPGDDCSLCERPLPQDWRPPVAEGLAAARKTHQDAQAALADARNKIRDLATRADMTSTQATELRQEAEDSREAARSAAERLARTLGRDQVNLAVLPPGDELLQPLASTVAEARENLAAYDQESQQLREQRAATQTHLEHARKNLQRSSAARNRSLDEANAAVQALRTDLSSLPDQLPIDIPLPDNPLDIEVVQLGSLDEAYRILDDRAQELDRRAQRREQLQQQTAQASYRLRDLNGRWADEILAPGNELVATVNGHRDALSDGIGMLNIREVTLQPAASLADPARLAGMVQALRETTEAVARRTNALAEEAQREADVARKTITRLAAELAVPVIEGCPADAEQVVARAEVEVTEAEVKARTAERAAEDFARQVTPLIRLRRIGGDLNLAYKVVQDLSAALKPGAFPKWLTLRRSRALLVHASRLLEQMSGGRYAFAELDDENAEWRVVDNDSGLARTPASLSGGEQFITSLALALGMVEMMARTGGRLESLWLDEGFGSLDRSNLDAAIEALASVAAGGRMVAVISHIRAVADQVSHVLAVTREVSGSRATWLSPTQRAELATGDLDSDTASALSGLLD